MTVPGDIVLKPNPPGGENPFDNLIDQDHELEQQGVQQSAFVASQRKDPAHWAQVVETAKRMKVSPAFVDQNWDAISKTDSHLRIVDDASQSPGLAQWLSDPDNATIAKDEIPALARVDKGVRLIAQPPQPPQPIAPDASVVGTIPRAQTTPYSTGFDQSVAAEAKPSIERSFGRAAITGYTDMKAAAGQLAFAYGHTTPERAAEFVADANKRSADLRAQEPAYAKEFAASQESHRNAIDAIVHGAPEFRRGQVLNALKGYAVGNVKTVGELLGMLESAVTNPTGFAYSTVESTPSMLPALAGGFAGSAGGPMGMIGGTFIGMAPLAVGSEINAELARRGYDITNAQSLRKAFADPQLMADIRGKAARAGVTSAAVSSLVAGFAGGLTAKAEAAGVGAAGKALATAGDVGVQAGGMGAAQLAGQVAGEKGDMSKVSLGAAAETAISMLGYGVGETAIGLSRRGLFHADPVEAARQVVDESSQAIKAQHDAQALSEVGQALKEAKVTSTVPDRVKALVETASGGEQASAVYFQDGEWDSYWQGKGTSPAQAAADIMGDDGKAYYESKNTGAPLAISLGDYVSKVAPTEHFDGLLNVARTEPGGMSLGEAHEYLQSLPATLGDLAKEAEAVPPVQSSAASIRAQVERQLIESGRSKAEAKTASELYESAFNALGERTGINPRVLFNDYNLQIRGPNSPEPIVRSEPPAGIAERRSLTEENDDARAAFDEVAKNIRAFPQERRQMFIDALKAPKDILDLKQSAPIVLKPGEAWVQWRPTPKNPWAVIDHEGNTLKTFADPEAADRFMTKQKLKYPEPTNADYKQESNQGERGRFRISARSRQAMIDLFKPADRSTFLHESGHLYLEVLGDLATGENASPEISKDYSTILQWLGKENRSQLGTEEHEQFARGFEAYLMEGKAPSPALRDAFFRFRNWLVKIYRNVASLNVELSPEIKGVFDRLLATDDEIQRAQSEQATTPLFDDPRAVGMSDEQAASFSQSVNDANQAATEALTTRLMKEIRREESKDWKMLKDGIRGAVESEAEKDPVLRALSLLTRGKTPLGHDLPEGVEPFKLSRQAIVDDFGKDRLESLPRPYVYSREGGVHPDAAAEALGFKSGDELLTALSKSEKPKDYIDRVTNERMQSEHGERLSDLEIRQVAATAVRNEKQTQVLRKTLEVLASDNTRTFLKLAQKVVGAVPPTEEVRAQADKIIGGKSVKEIRPILYERAAQQQARLARELFNKGDIQGAFDAKRKELLATEVLRSAEAAKDAISEGLRDLRKVFQSDKKLAKSRDMDLVNAARSVLSLFKLGQSDKPAESYLAQLKAYDPEMADVVQTMVDGMTERSQNYKDISVDEFRELQDSIDGLWNMARRVTQIEVDGVKMDRIQARDELIARATTLRGDKELPGYRRAVSGWEETKMNLLSFKAVSRRVEHWIRGFDGGDNEGVGRKYMVNRIAEAADQFRLAKREALTEYSDFLKSLKDEDMPVRKGKIPAPELDYTFSGHNELLGALLHRGNDSNFAKLLIGRGWGRILEDGTLDTSRWDALEKRLRSEGTLTKQHYDFVQGVWDRFDGLKAGAQRAHKEQFGRYFSEITHKEFSNEFGTYKGGYYPAKVDPLMVADAQARAEKDALLGANTNFMFPSVGKGFTKERVDNYRKPLTLDASAIPQHFDAVLRFTHLGPAVRDVARIVADPAFREAISALDPTIVADAIVPWLERAGQQRSEEAAPSGRFWGFANSVARKVRNNAALQIMTLNSTVILEQMTHFPSVFVRVDKGHMANALWHYMANHKEMTTAINDRSVFMRTRESAGLMEARKQIDKILLDPNVFQDIREFSLAHGRFLMSGIQSVMDHATWEAAYNQGLETMTEREAVRNADATVRELLGSYNPEDISKIEAGTPIQRLFTMFYGFWNTKGNVLATEGTIAKQVGLKKGAGRAAGAFFWGATIPFLLGHVIKTALSSKQAVEDDEGTAHALARHFGLSQFEGYGRMIPFAGPAVTFAEALFGQARPGALLDSPAIKLFQDAVYGSKKDLDQLLEGDEVNGKTITDFFTLIGLATGLPLRPLAKPISYIHSVHTGETVPTSTMDQVRGMLTGR